MTVPMRNNQPRPLPLAQIKGSWEERALQVARLLASDAPTALEQSQTLIDRLCRIPAAQREAANDRLNEVLVTAAVNQAQQQASWDDFAAAAATLRNVAAYLPVAIAHDLEMQALNYLLCTGETTTVLSTLETLAARSGHIDDWTELVWAGIRSGEYAYAQRGMEEAERWVNHTHQGALDTAAGKRDQAAVASLKARYSLAQGTYAEAVAWYEHAMTLDEVYGSNPSLLYRHLVNAEAFAEANKLLQRDVDAPTRYEFWSGLLEYRRGRLERAVDHWLKVTQHEQTAEEASRFFEFVLSHYYLGDKHGTGLAGVLEVLNVGEVSWGALYLAGLGWAMRGDMTAATRDFHLAAREYRKDGQGRLLPNETWWFCHDLVEPDRLEMLQEFFEDATL